MTNALKGIVVAWTKSLLVLLVAFGLPITDGQTIAIVTFVDVTVSFAATAWILATAKRSPARNPDYDGVV